MAERAARIGEWGLRGALAVEPGAMDAGDPAVRVGHGSEQSRPGLARSIAVWAIPERRMDAHRRPAQPSGYAARPDQGLRMVAGAGPHGAEHTAERGNASARERRGHEV